MAHSSDVAAPGPQQGTEGTAAAAAAERAEEPASMGVLGVPAAGSAELENASDLERAAAVAVGDLRAEAVAEVVGKDSLCRGGNQEGKKQQQKLDHLY